MFGLQAIDTALGLTFVYLLLSLICTAANELIAGILHLRAKNLAEGLKVLLTDKGKPDLLDQFKQHALIKSLKLNQDKLSYIPPRTFALVLLDLIDKDEGKDADKLAGIRGKVEELANDSDLKQTVRILMSEAGGNIEKLRENIEGWYNDAMTTVSGWYKRKTQFIVFFLAIAVTGLSNADTIHIAKTLSADPALREALVGQAVRMVGGNSNNNQATSIQASASIDTDKETTSSPPVEPSQQTVALDTTELRNSIDQLQTSGIPLGWKTPPETASQWFSKIIGLLLTTMAVSLGAPFWFDVLKKAVTIRSIGMSPDETEKQKTK